MRCPDAGRPGHATADAPQAAASPFPATPRLTPTIAADNFTSWEKPQKHNRTTGIAFEH